MPFTQAELSGAGYDVKAAPVDDWREYDEQNPVPNYFDFDWFSSRHPDLYHRFALTSTGMMHELSRLVDLSGLSVVEVGAGTGRVSIEAGRKARMVTAVDIFASTAAFGKAQMAQAGLHNVAYARGDCENLPFPGNTF
jgi:ubiquinone/menaquinone biosynthesis C-methylase UbiE